MPRFRLTSFLFLLALAAAGCAGIGEQPTIRLWSQTEAILPFVDRYNAGQRKFKIEVSYLASPADELLLSRTPPDLILSERLSAPACAARLESLAPLLHPEGVNPDLFYQDLLNRHRFRNAAVALPFSFTLPVIVFRKNAFPAGSPASLSLDELKAAGSRFTKIEKGKPTALGFAPLWNREFLFHSAALFDVRFRADSGRPLAWDEPALASWLKYLTGWCDEASGGFAAESDFIRTYLYEPPYAILQTKRANLFRMSFYHALIGDFARIPAGKREALGMAWLSRAQKIPADQSILFFGVPQGGANRLGAYDFLKWAYHPDNQKLVLEANAKANPLSFGLADGFSALVPVNEKHLPTAAGFLSGRIPKESQIVFPDPVPETWGKIKNETLIPWIYDRLARKNGSQTLQDRFK